jgi:hypothetical protein
MSNKKEKKSKEVPVVVEILDTTISDITIGNGE